MPMRRICKTKTGKRRKMTKAGRCPKGSRMSRIRTKRARRRRR